MRATWVLFLACLVVGGGVASAQTPSSDAGIAALRAELQAERARIETLQHELDARLDALAALSARIDAVSGAPAGPAAAVPAPPAPGVVAQVPVSPPESPAAPAPPRFDFYADTLVRLATLHQGYDGCEGCPDRNIGRMRLRMGVEGRLGPGVRGVLGLSTGELNDPNSVFQTFGGNLGRKAATFDRGFISYRPTRAPWVEVSAGKFPYPWTRSSMTFDVDFYPEGASERVTWESKRRGVLRGLSLQGMQVVVNEQPEGADTLLVGGQATATIAWRGVTTRALATAIDVRRPDFVLRAQQDGTDISVRNTNAIVGPAPLSRYLSGFRYANLIVENTVATRWPALPLTVTLEWQRNVKAATTRDSAASFRAEAGRQVRRGDWFASWHVFRVEQDAIVSALGESDWRAPSNVLQHRFGLVYTAQEHVQTLFTWYRGRTLDTGVADAVVVPGLRPGAREPWANRLYFDVVYRF